MRFSMAVFSSRFKTFPRPLGLFKKYIEPKDIVYTSEKFSLVNARPHHVPLLIDSVKDFLRSEPTCQALKVTNPSDEYSAGFLFNATRYPYSYFAVNKQDEIMGLAMYEVIYKDAEKDPRPRFPLPVNDPKDNFKTMSNILNHGERMLFDILNVDKVLLSQMAYVPSSLRRKRISSSMKGMAMERSMKEAVENGVKFSISIITNKASLGNVRKQGYTVHANVPEELYFGVDGKKVTVPGEETALVVSLDMEKALMKESASIKKQM